MKYPSQLTDITGVILAGGQATRMGGVDKGLVELGGRPQIEHVLDALAPQVGEILISANRNLDRYAGYGRRIVQDRPGHAGPLAGIFSALLACESEFLLTVPCDAPQLPRDLADRLYRALNEHGASACIPHDGTRLQPAFALLRRGLIEDLRAYLDAGDRKLGLWLSRLEPAVCDYADQPGAFVNINTLDELRGLEQRLGPRP